ncbi:hypothetical protein HDU87_008773 [Geranomyces variabilis]|uniref:Metallo-beta-lactamase domain-containing protein n=1 Tax=Geranomyces variabilis TaxID=109894 RepID=A0AAD5TEV6_9FUNG|nr:hypothetical protein HDU87_008773 [Geranomyces variabilis]
MTPVVATAAPPRIPLSLHVAGHCQGLERFMFSGGAYAHVDIPSVFVLLNHPVHGYCLYDTGYSQENKRQTEAWPGWVYGAIVPITIKEGHSAREQLQKQGVSPADIKYILISHFHGDHIGGLKDFPNAKFVYFHDSLTRLETLAPIRQTLHAFLPGLLPADFKRRSIALDYPTAGSLSESGIGRTIVQTPEPFGPLGQACIDLFGDGSMLVVPLPGHCTGQLGLIVRNGLVTPLSSPAGSANPGDTGSAFMFVGDACWDSRTVQELALPHPLTFWVVHIDKPAYLQTIKNLHSVWKAGQGSIEIVPAHCRSMVRKWVKPEWNSKL